MSKELIFSFKKKEDSMAFNKIKEEGNIFGHINLKSFLILNP